MAGRAWWGLGLAALLATGVGSGAPAAEPLKADLVIRGGTILDGTGSPGVQGDVALRGDRIVAIGQFEVAPGAKTIDATGLVVTPGFIDLHSHSDETILKPGTRSNLNYLAQGVTTVVTGNCGGGPIDVEAFLGAVDRHGSGTNIIHLIPQGSLRRFVMGNAERPPTADELGRMKTIADRGMGQGAWGLSTGLIYVPSRYAATAELIEVSRVVARHGGIYASHIRDEGSGLLDSIEEAIRIGEVAGLPVHISHLKANGRENWGLSRLAIERIAKAREAGQTVTADQYPYTASSTKLGAMVVPHWARQGTAADFARIADDPVQGARLRAEIVQELARHENGASIRIASFPDVPSRVGLDLVTIAQREGTTPLHVVLDIERRGGAQAISFGMSEDDVREIMTEPFVATASDGSAHAPGGGDKPHPRAYGTFPRKLRYALDEHVLPFETAVHSMTGLPAEILGLPERGTLRVGSFADIAVFDPKEFRDASTYDDPTRYATGLKHLFVNGQAVIANGLYQRRLAGRALRLGTDGPADLIVKTGRIWTGNAENPWAEAIASRGGVLVAVGSTEDVAPFEGPMTRVLDLPGSFAMPGLVDAHGHMSSLGSSLDEIDLRGVSSVEEVARRVAERIKAQPGDGWILGQNWDQSLWPGGAFPTAADLDKVAPDRPVWLTRVDGHAGWANSEALRRAGVVASTEAPADGQIIQGSDGQPTGVFIDGAKGLIMRKIPPPTREDITRYLLAAQEQAIRAGLTGVHDAGISSLEAQVYRKLDSEGRLKLRVYAMAAPPSGGEAAFVRQRPKPAGRRFQMRAIKLFMDGAMGSRGALMFEPYADDPSNTGLMLIEPDTLHATTVEALKHGWQVCTHAIGDKGNALVLDAYSMARAEVPEANDSRLRIEHAQVVRKEDVERFRQTGTIASMQPSHASTDKRWAEARLGPERVKGAYAWRWFADAGVPLAFGSDFPVEIVNPLWGIYAGVTRRDARGEPPGGWHPEHCLTLEEVLRGFTAGAAHAAFAEDRLGILRPGMRADLTIVGRDLFQVPPEQILDAQVVATIIDGEVGYEKEASTSAVANPAGPRNLESPR